MKTIESIFMWMGVLGLLIWIIAIIFPGISYNSEWITLELWRLGVGGVVLSMSFSALQTLIVLLCKFKNIPTKYYWNIYVPSIAFMIYMSATIVFLYFPTISMAIITLAMFFLWLTILALVGKDYIDSMKNTKLTLNVGHNETYTTED
jgi:hypothetical protein